MKRRSFIALASAALLAACSQPGKVYKLPIAEARTILVATGLPPEVFGSEEPTWEVKDEGSQISWIITRDGGELFRYVAYLSEEGPDKTRVRVELEGAEDGPGGDVAKRLAEKPQIRDMYQVAVTERVASALEKRSFDIARIYPAMTAAAASNIGQLNASADEAAAASEKEARDNIAKAYADEANGARH